MKNIFIGDIAGELQKAHLNLSDLLKPDRFNFGCKIK
jgi:hypothetical protein